METTAETIRNANAAGGELRKMGIDATLLWNDRTEDIDKQIADKIIKQSEQTARQTGLDPLIVANLNVPELGVLRERYGLYYHFLPFFFREAWEDKSHNMLAECRISSMTFEWRVREALYDLMYLTETNKRRDSMNKKNRL